MHNLWCYSFFFLHIFPCHEHVMTSSVLYEARFAQARAARARGNMPYGTEQCIGRMPVVHRHTHTLKMQNYFIMAWLCWPALLFCFCACFTLIPWGNQHSLWRSQMSLSSKTFMCVMVEMDTGELDIDEVEKKSRVMNDNTQSDHNIIARFITQLSVIVCSPFSDELQ